MDTKLSDDLLRGAGAIAEFALGKDNKKNLRVSGDWFNNDHLRRKAVHEETKNVSIIYSSLGGVMVNHI